MQADKKNLKFNTVMQDLQHWRPNDLLTVRLRSKQNRTAMEELHGTLDRYYLEHNRNKEVISLSFCRQKCILLIKHYKKLHLNACSLIKILT